ncbi:MAG: hypothetical protein V3U28_00925 [Candidatus Acidoferrales bacterium]
MKILLQWLKEYVDADDPHPRPKEMNLGNNAATLLALAALLASGSACAAENQNRTTETSTREFLVKLSRWPGEGVPVIAVDVGQSVAVYKDPGSVRPAKTVEVRQNQTLEWDETTILVYQFGQMEISEPVTAEIYVFSGIDPHGQMRSGRSTTREFSRGEKIDIVSYLAEGAYLFSQRGEYFAMSAEDKGRLLREPETEWWIHVNQPQEFSGWVRVDGQQVKVIDRTF